jgi:hypothetical protein
MSRLSTTFVEYFRCHTQNITFPTHKIHSLVSNMPHFNQLPLNTNTMAFSLVDDKALMIKNVPTHFPEAAVHDFFMRDPYQGVWACNANKRFNHQTKSSEIIPGQYFINFMSPAEANRFRHFWSVNPFFGTQLRIEVRTLRRGQVASVATQGDIDKLNTRMANFLARNVGPYPNMAAPPSAAPVFARALDASAPAFVAAAPVFTAASPVIVSAPTLAAVPASAHTALQKKRPGSSPVAVSGAGPLARALARGSTEPSRCPASSLDAIAAAERLAQALARASTWPSIFSAFSPAAVPGARPLVRRLGGISRAATRSYPRPAVTTASAPAGGMIIAPWLPGATLEHFWTQGASVTGGLLGQSMGTTFGAVGDRRNPYGAVGDGRPKEMPNAKAQRTWNGQARRYRAVGGRIPSFESDEE